MFDDFTVSARHGFVCRLVSYRDFCQLSEIQLSELWRRVSERLLSIKWVVYEKNTGKIFGFIRKKSSTINTSSKNLTKQLTLLDAKVMKRFNDSAIMGTFSEFQHNHQDLIIMVNSYLPKVDTSNKGYT